MIVLIIVNQEHALGLHVKYIHRPQPCPKVETVEITCLVSGTAVLRSKED